LISVRIPSDHPRAESLHVREKLVQAYSDGIVATSGLIAHGRGEAFDYLLNERTSRPARNAAEAAAAILLTAKSPVISVNGNTAALAAKDMVRLGAITDSKIEINLFYRSRERELAIRNLLLKAGAHEVLGVGANASARIPELSSERRRVDPKGILSADVVLVPLEDGDRTEALVRMGKKVIAIDLNPLSRTAQKANVTIVDNLVRCAPLLIEVAEGLKKKVCLECEKLARDFDNGRNLAESIRIMKNTLSTLAKTGLANRRLEQ